MAKIADTVKSQYAKYYGSSDLSEWRRLGAIDKVDNIENLHTGCVPPHKIIDIGCGDGAIISRMMERGFGSHYWGIDVSPSAILAAKAQSEGRDNAAFDVFDGNRIAANDQSFDLAILSHVVEHLEHPRVLLSEAARVAKQVFVEVPCEHTMRLPRDYQPDTVGHINFYTPTTIRRLVQTCGLEVRSQITRNVSISVIRYSHPVLGYAQFALREAFLLAMPRLAPNIFVYHTALLCEPHN